MRHVRALQGFIWLIPIMVFGYLAWQELVPTGVFSFARTAGESSPFIDRLLPDGRVTLTSDTGARAADVVTGDPAFFFVHPHRSFEGGSAEIVFQNAGAPIIEFGGLAREDGQVYDLHPVQNARIDTLDWSRIEERGITLLQRTPSYDSVASFLANPPSRDQIATYHYTLARPYRLVGYSPHAGTRVIEASLRGFHEAKFYAKDEPLELTVSFTDENRSEGPDPFDVIVFDASGTAIASTHAQDDGNTRTDARPSAVRTVSLSLPQLSEGVYKIELRGGTDIFTRRIETSLHKIVFLNTVIVGDEVGYRAQPSSVQMWTEAKSLAFETTHAEGVQTIRVGTQSVSVSDPFVRVSTVVEADGVVRVSIPQGDMRVFGDGHYAFAPEQYFNPDPVRLGPDTSLDRLGVNYVIADYQPPEEEGEWLIARVPFDPSLLVLRDGAWKFALSLPGITQAQGTVRVHSIRFTMTRPPLTILDLLTALKTRVL